MEDLDVGVELLTDAVADERPHHAQLVRLGVLLDGLCGGLDVVRTNLLQLRGQVGDDRAGDHPRSVDAIEAAGDLTVVFGFVEESREFGFYNAAAVVESGRKVTPSRHSGTATGRPPELSGTPRTGPTSGLPSGVIVKASESPQVTSVEPIGVARADAEEG